MHCCPEGRAVIEATCGDRMFGTSVPEADCRLARQLGQEIRENGPPALHGLALSPQDNCLHRFLLLSLHISLSVCPSWDCLVSVSGSSVGFS